MIELVYSGNDQRADVKQRGSYILNSKGAIETAVLLSIFADNDWWGGTIIGSGLPRFIDRGKLSNKTLRDIQTEAVTALQWLVDDGVAQSVSVNVQKNGVDGVSIECIVKRDNNNEPAIVRVMWDGYANGT